MKKYLIIIENSGNGYSAYSPDIEGCVAFGFTKEEVESEISTAVKAHIEELRKEGYKLPEPKSYAKYMEIEA